MGIIEMKKEPRSNFKFGQDDRNADAIYPTDPIEQKLDRLQHRITLLYILLPLFIGILLVAAYFNLENRVFARIDTDGLQNLSKDLESRFSSLSVKFATLEEAFSKKISPMDEIFLEVEKSTSALREAIAKTDEAVKGVASVKVDKPAFASALEKIEQTLSPLEGRIRVASDQIETMDNRLGERLAIIDGTFEKTANDLRKLQGEIAALGEAGRGDRGAFDRELSGFRNEQKELQQRLSQLVRIMELKENETETFRKRIVELEKTTSALERERPSSSGRSASAAKPAAPGTEAAPPSGRIVEETIKP
jgi:chromosome segregation ATPase